jgi:3-oxoacyl-[acyl-carrier-protein] synthase-3
MIFGDGGTATALERTEGKSMKYFLNTKGANFKSIIVPAGHARTRSKNYLEDSSCELSMNGSEVFAFTITDVPRTIKSFMSRNNINKDDIDLFVFHQANLFILKHLAKKLNIPLEKVPISIDRFGNTSGESIPLTLVDALGEEESNEKIKLFLCGFGVGLSWGGIYTEVDKSFCLPMIYTSDYYKEG